MWRQKCKFLALHTKYLWDRVWGPFKSGLDNVNSSFSKRPQRLKSLSSLHSPTSQMIDHCHSVSPGGGGHFNT